MNDELARLRFVLLAIALVLASNVTGALTRAGPAFALGSTALTFVLMLAWTAYRRDPVLARWLTLGFVAGWVEIVTDAWIVRSTQTLAYPAGEPMVWESPLYMPFAWTIVLAQLGIVGGWLSNRMSLAKATVVCALLGGLMIPFYELLAHHANYWKYTQTPMLWKAPLYIILSEFLLALPLVWMYRVGQGRSHGVTIALGLAAGVWMLPSVAFAWLVLGPCEGAWIQFSCH
jgi:hypothetical protein